MAKGYKVTDVGKAVEATYKRFEASLPLGVSVDQISNQPDVVTDAVSEFMHALGEALIIVLVVSFLSIGWRSGLVIAIAIPLVLAATFAIMYELGIDLQRISLGALIIALGLLVDDAMIVVEMMERKLEEGLVKLDAASFAYTSTAFPMLTGTLITTAGFIPVGFAASTAGEYVRTLFYVVGIALDHVVVRGGLFHAMARLHDPEAAPSRRQSSRCLRYALLPRACAARVGWAVRHRGIVLVLTLATFVASLWAFQFIPQNFFPQSSRPEILVDLWLPEGTSIKEVETQAKALEARWLDDKDKRFIATYIGEGAPRFFLPLDQQLPNPNFAQLLVMAKDEPARERLIVKLRGHSCRRFPLDPRQGRPPVPRPADRLAGADARHGSGPAGGAPHRRRGEGERFAADPLLGAVHDDWLEPVPAMKLVIDQDRARALGVTSQRIRQMLQATMSGAPLGDYPRRRGDGVHRGARAGAKPPPAVGGQFRLYPDRFRRLRAAVAGGQGGAGARAGHRMAPRPSADDHRARRHCRTACSPTMSSTKLYSDMQDLRDSLPAGYKIEIQGGPRIRPKARPRSPPRRRSCCSSSSCC